MYRASEGITYYIVGGMEENELLLASVLGTLLEVLNMLLRYVYKSCVSYPHRKYRNKVDKRSLLDNWDTLLLAIDEIIDEG